MHNIFATFFRALILTGAALGTSTYAVTPAEQLAALTTQAATAAQPARGQQFFTSKHGKDWSCSSCHGATPTVGRKTRQYRQGDCAAGARVSTPSDLYRSPQKPRNGFSRNCNDVVGRECTASEKGRCAGLAAHPQTLILHHQPTERQPDAALPLATALPLDLAADHWPRSPGPG
jgi:hypothetical protein